MQHWYSSHYDPQQPESIAGGRAQEELKESCRLREGGSSWLRLSVCVCLGGGHGDHAVTQKEVYQRDKREDEHDH